MAIIPSDCNASKKSLSSAKKKTRTKLAEDSSSRTYQKFRLNILGKHSNSLVLQEQTKIASVLSFLTTLPNLVLRAKLEELIAQLSFDFQIRRMKILKAQRLKRFNNSSYTHKRYQCFLEPRMVVKLIQPFEYNSYEIRT